MVRSTIQPAVYIMASKRNGTLYVGHTADLPRRVSEHRDGVGSRFTSEHHVGRLVWYEFHDSLDDAQRRESLVKRWKRKWKLDLIEAHNPEWRDLYLELA